VTITEQDGVSRTLPSSSLPEELSSEIFRRTGRIRRVSLDLPSSTLLRSDSAVR
jgi:hypothetical protein